MDSQLQGLLLQTIYTAARTGIGAVDPTYGTPASMAARVELRTATTKSADGLERTTDYLIFTTTAVGLLDRVWLPGEYTSASDGKHRLPASVERVVDWTGAVTHYEIRL